MNAMSKSIIVGTAGHIDHGKSALVEALTGTHPDRLEEEKRRGITIDLGFAFLEEDGVRFYGAAVYLVMNLMVLPLTAVAPSPITTSALLNGLLGHALFLGLPIALFARKLSA
jgi:hypothetical protein